MTSFTKPIAVVGGGVAAFALVRALLARGLDARSFERRSPSAPEDLAVNLPGNAIAALTALGLREEIEALGRPVRRREYRTAQDRLLFAVDEDEFWGSGAQPRSIRRADLAQILSNGLPNHVLHRGVQVYGMSVLDDEAELVMGDGSSFLSELVVGADGVRSFVRRTAFDGIDTISSSVLADASWRFMAPNPGIDCWTVWAGSRGMVLLMPSDKDEVYGWVAATRGGGSGLDPIAVITALVGEFPDVCSVHSAQRSVALAVCITPRWRKFVWRDGRLNA